MGESEDAVAWLEQDFEQRMARRRLAPATGTTRQTAVEPHYSELYLDASADRAHFVEWYCRVPPRGIRFEVTDCEWNADFSVRRIYAIKILTEKR